MALTSAQKKQLSSISKSLSTVSKSLSSLSPSDRKKFESSSASDALSRSLSEGSRKVSNLSASGGRTTERAVPADQIGQEQKMDIPVFTPITKVPDIAANNLGLTSPTLGLEGSQFTPIDAQISAAQEAQDQSFKDYFKTVMGMETPQSGDIQRKLERETGIRDLRQQEANISGQINTIIANRDANVLRVEGQGRGIPEAIIGGQQAQINKEAAIAALPLQAQLASVQGNIALAQDYINTWGKILMQDAQNEYNKNMMMANAVYEYADKRQQGIIDDLKAQKAQNLQIAQNNISYIRDLQMMAIETGQQYLIPAFGDIDPMSDTFEQDIARLQARIQIPQAPSAPITKTVGDDLVQYNPETGQWELAYGAGNGNAPTTGTSPITGKPYTQSQTQAGVFAKRMEEAERIFQSDDFEVFSTKVGEFIPEMWKGEDRKTYEQASKNFVTAVLRKESGAAIGEEEFKDAAKIYIPAPGDTQDVLEEKKIARDIVFMGMVNESVGAYEELVGLTSGSADFQSSAGKSYQLPNK